MDKFSFLSLSLCRALSLYSVSEAHVILFKAVYVPAQSLQSCPTLCDPTDRSPPGSSVFKANHSLCSLVPLGSCFSSKSSSWIFNFHFFLATFRRLTLSLLLFLRFLIKRCIETMSTFSPSIHTSSRCSLNLFIATVDIANGLWQSSPTWLPSCIWSLWQFLFFFNISLPWFLKQKMLIRGGKNTQKNYAKTILMTQVTMMVWSLT